MTQRFCCTISFRNEKFD